MRSLLTATKLRFILSLSLFIIVSLSIISVYFIYTQLNRFAGEVSSTSGEAASGQVNLLALQSVTQKLKTQQDAINRAQKIVTDSGIYKYQEPVITDLNNFAKDSGVTISSFNFISSSSTAPTTSAPTTAGGVTPLISTSNTGIKSTTVTITLKSPVNYVSLLKFIRHIENNLTRMQISKLTLTRDPVSGGVTTDTLAIQVYMR